MNAHQIRTDELLLMCERYCYTLVPYRDTDTDERVVQLVFW